jgi:hypothetical protein
MPFSALLTLPPVAWERPICAQVHDILIDKKKGIGPTAKALVDRPLEDAECGHYFAAAEAVFNDDPEAPLPPEPASLREARTRFELAAAEAFQADPANVEKFGLPAHPARVFGEPPRSWRDAAAPIYWVLLSALAPEQKHVPAGEGLWMLAPSTEGLRIKEGMYRAVYSLIPILTGETPQSVKAVRTCLFRQQAELRKLVRTAPLDLY